MAARTLANLLAAGQITTHATLDASQDPTLVALGLRQRAAHGAPILLAQKPRRSVWARLSGLLGHREGPLGHADHLARGLLLAGLERPCVVLDTPELVAVTAYVPLEPDALDQIFFDEARNR